MKLADYLYRNEISQTEFAKAIGVTRAAVNRWIRLGQAPKPVHMRSVMAATGNQVRRKDFQNDKQP